MQQYCKDPNVSNAKPGTSVLSQAQLIKAFGYPFKLISIASWGGVRAKQIANAEEVEEALRWAAHENKVPKTNIYFEPNESRAGLNQKSGDADIVYLRSVKVDIDAKDGRTVEDCLAIVDGLPIKPSIVVFSGGGYQAHYLLQGRVNMAQVELYKAVGLKLRELAGNGDNVSEPSRAMRCPGFVNWPHQPSKRGREPKLASVVSASLRRRTLADLAKAFGVGEQSREAAGFAGRPPHLQLVSNNDDLSAGVDPGWFSKLDGADQDAALKGMLAVSSIRALADTSDGAPEPNWRTVVAACARSGARNAYELCLEWAKTSKRFEQGDFDRRWSSYVNSDPERGITIASLIKLAIDGGWDAEPWRAKANAAQGEGQGEGEAEEQGAAPAQGRFVIPSLLREETAIEQINKVYGYTPDWGGQGTYFRFNAYGRADPCKRDDIQNALANRRIVMKDGKIIPAFPFWNGHSQRREAAKAVYAPNQWDTDAAGRHILNLWRGFERTPRRGRCSLMLRHILNVVCSGEKKLFRYLIQWMAHLIQKPDEAPGVVVVLRGDEEGAGKTIVGSWLCAMLGDHGLMLDSPGQLIGKFNAHLENRSLVVVNEPSWAGDKDVAAKLKSMVTDPTLSIERKYGGVYTVRNNLHLMFTTNARWAVPAGARARRYFVLDVPKTRVGDHAYFARLRAEAESGGIEALMHLLGSIKLDGFNVRDFPITEALREQQERSLSLEAEWALDLVDREDGGGFGTRWFGHRVESRALYEDYEDYARKHRGRALSSKVFGRWLGKLGVQRWRTNAAKGWTMPAADDFAKMVRDDAGIHD